MLIAYFQFAFVNACHIIIIFCWVHEEFLYWTQYILYIHIYIYISQRVVAGTVYQSYRTRDYTVVTKIKEEMVLVCQTFRVCSRIIMIRCRLSYQYMTQTRCSLSCPTGRERISSKNVAHIMNNEAQRKYLVSVKRLMTYLQDKRTDIAPSKKVR